MDGGIRDTWSAVTFIEQGDHPANDNDIPDTPLPPAYAVVVPYECGIGGASQRYMNVIRLFCPGRTFASVS